MVYSIREVVLVLCFVASKTPSRSQNSQVVDDETREVQGTPLWTLLGSKR